MLARTKSIVCCQATPSSRIGFIQIPKGAEGEVVGKDTAGNVFISFNGFMAMIDGGCLESVPYGGYADLEDWPDDVSIMTH